MARWASGLTLKQKGLLSIQRRERRSSLSCASCHPNDNSVNLALATALSSNIWNHMDTFAQSPMTSNRARTGSLRMMRYGYAKKIFAMLATLSLILHGSALFSTRSSRDAHPSHRHGCSSMQTGCIQDRLPRISNIA